MLKNIIVHVGMYKTGSTSIQEAFGSHSCNDIEYLDIPAFTEDLREFKNNHSLTLLSAFSSAFQEIREFTDLGYSNDQISALRVWARDTLTEKLSNCKSNTALISAESVLDIDAGGLIEFRNLLLEHAKTILIYAYIRPPIEFIESATSQQIKTGYALTEPHPIRYKKYFDKIENIFGEENVKYRTYKKDMLINGNVVHDFADWIGCKNKILEKRLANLSFNESPSTEALKCLYNLNTSNMPNSGNAELVRARSALLKDVSSRFPGKFQLPYSIVTKGIDIEDIDWMESRLKARFDLPNRSSLYVESLDEYMRDPAPSTEQAINEILTSINGIPMHTNSFQDSVVQLFLEALRTESGLLYDHRTFDGDGYNRLHPDVRESGIHPFGHYILWGKSEGRRLC